MNSFLGILSSVVHLTGGSGQAAPTAEMLSPQEAALYDNGAPKERLHKGDFSPAATGCDMGFVAFKNTVFPLIRNKCATCHDSPAIGPIQGPAHSVQDPEVAYKRVSGYMNFDSIMQSQFLIKGGNNHCAAYGIQCNVSVNDLKTSLQAWMDLGQKTCPPAFKLVTQPSVIPADLPLTSTGNWKRIQFKLDSLGDDFGGTFMDIEVQQFALPSPDHPGAYRFRNPRLATPDQAFAVKGIHFFVNGKRDSRENMFTTVNVKVNNHKINAESNASDFPVLSTKTLIVLQDKAMGDQISLAFDRLEAIPNPMCKAPEVFRNKVMPILVKRSCVECHGGGTDEGVDADAMKAMSLKGTEAKVCSEFLQRVNWTDFTLSPIVQLPLNGMNGHGRFLPFSREVFPDWIEWMKMEKTNAPAF